MFSVFSLGDMRCKQFVYLKTLESRCERVLVSQREHPSRSQRLLVAKGLKIRVALMNKRQVRNADLHTQVLLVAEEVITKHGQGKFFTDDLNRIVKNARIAKKSNVIDNRSVLVVGGRLVHLSMTDTHKFPIILPYQNNISTLIVRSIHNRCHIGREWLLSLLRKKFWIIKARSVIRRVSKNCVTCIKLFAAASSQKMADLPSERLQRPFTHVGLFVFRPFIIKRARHELKRYGCIFVCFNVRAIHIETSDDLENNTLINALRRFIARRGTPTSILSDNETNIRGGHSELAKSMSQVDGNLIRTFCTKHHIEWKFNVPYASHMGEVYERMIRTVRKILTGMLMGRSRLTDDILRTFFCEAESIVNSRPITKMSDDPKDDIPLTPANFLLIEEGPILTPGRFSPGDI